MGGGERRGRNDEIVVGCEGQGRGERGRKRPGVMDA